MIPILIRRLCQRTFLLVIVLSMVIPFISISGEALQLDPSIIIQIGTNQNYTTSHLMTFSQVDDAIPLYNTTEFHISSAHGVNISLIYLASNVLTTTDGAVLLAFNATVTSGNVYFNITGFRHNDDYDIYIDNVFNETITSSISGTASFNYNSWSTHEFELRYTGGGGYVPIPSSPTTNYLVVVIIPLMIAVSLLTLLVALFFTGNIDVRTLIIWLVMVVIAIAVISVIL